MTLNTIDTDKEYVNTEDAFAHLFNKEDLSQIPEAVLWKKYSVADVVSFIIWVVYSLQEQ